MMYSFDDVWVRSGQSNMKMTIINIFNATEEIENAGKYPKIRVFTAERESSIAPVEELIQIRQNWSLASPSPSPSHPQCFSVHSRTKLDVGYRLSRSGLAVAYGQKVQFQGLIVSNVNYINGSNTITLTYTAGNSIEIRNSMGFEVSILFVFSY